MKCFLRLVCKTTQIYLLGNYRVKFLNKQNFTAKVDESRAFLKDTPSAVNQKVSGSFS